MQVFRRKRAMRNYNISERENKFRNRHAQAACIVHANNPIGIVAIYVYFITPSPGDKLRGQRVWNIGIAPGIYGRGQERVRFEK